MEAESFFARWSQRNAEAAAARHEQEEADPLPKEELPPPTLEDVAALTPESDFKPFVARGVDENVRRSAMKKLFADPHFNVMDGLDVYIDDYNKFEPLTPQMLAMMTNVQALLDPLSQLENPLLRLLEKTVEDAPADLQPAQKIPDAIPESDTPPDDGTQPSKDQDSHDDPL